MALMTAWDRAHAAERRAAASLRRGDIPDLPGVYIWFRGGDPVYVGEAKTSLRQRLGAHLSKSPDLSRSTLRRSVALAELGIPRSMASVRPTVITAEQAAAVTTWLGECEVAWLVCDGGDHAHQLETSLRAERLPPLNRV